MGKLSRFTRPFKQEFFKQASRSVQLFRVLITALTFFIVRNSRSFGLRMFKKDEAFTTLSDTLSEVEKVGAKLRHVEFDLTRVLVSHRAQLIDDKVLVLARIKSQNHIENVSFPRMSLLRRTSVAWRAIIWSRANKILKFRPPLLPILLKK